MDNNIFKQAERLISRTLIEKYFSIKGSKWKGKEFWTLSPLRADKNIKSGSFSIGENGCYNDLVSQESGNFVQLVSKKYNLSLKEAAEKIISDSGNVPMTKSTDSEKPEKKKKLPAIIPIPESTDEALLKIISDKYWKDQSGEVVNIYNYRDISGARHFVTVRFEKPSEDENKKPEKQVIPFHYTSKGWRAGRPEMPGKKLFPLFGAQQLGDPENSDKPVIIVEGEKCKMVPVQGHILLSSIGGGNSADKSDWSILEGRRVIIWPDYDQKKWTDAETGKAGLYNQLPGDVKIDACQPGMIGAFKIKQLVTHSEILDVKTGFNGSDVNTFDGYDIADAADDGIDLVNFAENCPRLFDRETPGTPFEAFELCIDDIYGRENIDQFDGLYYYYNEKNHCWEERLQINIESDLQKWIIKNHINFLLMSEISVHTFVGNTAMFLKRHAREFYTKNPFKESALSPYLHFKNGAVHIKDDGFDFIDRVKTGEHFFKNLYPTHCMKFEYDNDLYKNDDLKENAPAFHYYIDSLLPSHLEGEMRDLELENTIDFYSQVIAYCLNPVKRRPRFFAMYGNQDSGKSFLIDVLQSIIGDKFFVVRQTKDMDNRFAASDLWGSKIFVDDDVKSDLTLPDAFIKLYSGMKSVTIEKKNKDAIKGVKISVAMFFISNHLFSLSGGNEGIARRVIYMPYSKTIPKVDLFLLDKIVGRVPKGKESGTREGATFDERPAIIGLALRGLQKLIKDNHEFIMPIWVRNEREEWIVQSDSINQFLAESVFEDSEAWKFKKSELLDRYRDWCKEENRKPYGKSRFYGKIKQLGGVDIHKMDGDYFEFPGRKKDLIDFM